MSVESKRVLIKTYGDFRAECYLMYDDLTTVIVMGDQGRKPVRLLKADSLQNIPVLDIAVSTAIYAINEFHEQNNA